MKIKNYMDAITASAVESCNKALKYGSHSIHSRMNLGTTCRRVLIGANCRIWWRRNDAKGEMLLNNHSSQGQTNDFSLRKVKVQLIANMILGKDINVSKLIWQNGRFGNLMTKIIWMKRISGGGLTYQNSKEYESCL